jgi:membrane protease YdiL (CAAX protease family)
MFNSKIMLFTLATVVTVIVYLLYRLVLTDRFSQKLNLINGSTKHILVQRISGMILFGCIPLSIVMFSDEGLGSYGISYPTTGSYVWTLVFAALIIPMNYFNASSPENLEMYPQIRKEVWSVQLISISTLSWAGYLIAYEFLFRGFLLFSTIPYFGVWPAIGLNVVIYSIAHIHKGKKEMLGAVPLGFVVSYLAYITGSFLVALFIHLVLALSNEWFSIIRHPAMVFKLAWK